MNLEALRARLAELRQTAQAQIDAATADNRTAMTEAEQSAFDSAMTEAEGVEANIARLESLAAAQARDNEVRPPPPRGPGPPTNPPGDPAVREFEDFGQFMHAVAYNRNDQRLSSLWRNRAEMSEGGANAEQRMDNGAAGGFMVPTQFREGLLRVDGARAVVRPRARVIPAGSPPDAAIEMAALDQTGSGVRDGHTRGGVKVFKVAEGAPKPRTGFKLRMVRLEPQEFAATMEATDKLLRNWSAASSTIESLFREAMAEQEDFEFLRGNGVGGPLGFLNSPATIGVPRATANTVTYEDLTEMLARSRGPLTWGYTREILPALMGIKDDAGHLIWQPSAREGVPSTLLGAPAVESENNPGKGLFGDLWAADLDKYLIKDGSGPFVASSEHVKFEENKIFWNVDGQPWLTAPFTNENGYQSSPFVALDAPEG